MPEMIISYKKQDEKDEVEAVVNKYSKMLFCICYTILMNKYDAEDALQETFLAYLKKGIAFNSEEHKKAWLIKVAQNNCKNKKKYKNTHSHLNYDDLENVVSDINNQDRKIFEILTEMPHELKLVMILHYIYGYSAKEISKIIGKSERTVWKRIGDGKNFLKEEFEEG